MTDKDETKMTQPSITLTIPRPRLPRFSGEGASRTPGRLIAGLVALVIVALIATAVILRQKEDDRTGVANARSAAVTAATALVPQIVGYGYQSFAQDAKSAQDATTGKFKQTLATLENMIKPAVMKQKVTKTATITDAAVVSATATTASVLIFVTQKNSVSGKAPVSIPARLQVSMSLVNGRWLVSDIHPV